jgi:hypothetical protein
MTGARLQYGDELGEVSAPQAVYLDAFQELTRADTMAEAAAARRRMGRTLNYVLADAGLELPNDTRWRDSLSEQHRALAEEWTR